MWEDPLAVYIFGILLGLIIACLLWLFGKRVKNPVPKMDRRETGGFFPGEPEKGEERKDKR